MLQSLRLRISFKVRLTHRRHRLSLNYSRLWASLQRHPLLLQDGAPLLQELQPRDPGLVRQRTHCHQWKLQRHSWFWLRHVLSSLILGLAREWASMEAAFSPLPQWPSRDVDLRLNFGSKWQTPQIQTLWEFSSLSQAISTFKPSRISDRSTCSSPEIWVSCSVQA